MKEQTTKETFREEGPIEIKQFRKKSREGKMRNTAYFNNMPYEKKTFRVKHVSNSPAKKKTEGAQFSGTLTLYGQKLGLSKEKEERKVMELMTFYGKGPKEGRSKELGKGEIKKNIRNRGHLELNELMECETRIKNNFSQKIYLKDLRVSGLKERVSERRNKFC